MNLMERLTLLAQAFGADVKTLNTKLDAQAKLIADIQAAIGNQPPVDPEEPEVPSGPIYTLATRPMIDDVLEGDVINVSDLRIGSKQKRVNGNYLTIGRDVIIDTDWWTDSDDVVAMRIACHLERLGHINILGVALSTTQDIGPASLDGFLQAEANKKYRIAVPKTPHTPTHALGSFQPGLSQLPHDAGTPETMENAVTMYRSLLANAKGKVDIITIGFLNNLEELLKSPADSISPLTGLELVTQKVNLVYTMGGLWPNSQGGNMPGSNTEGEYNLAKTPQARVAANYVLANWPTEIIFSGYTVGYTIFSGSNLESRIETDNVAKAMQSHGDFNGSPKGRPSWDPLKILLGGAGFDNNSVMDSIAPHGYTLVRGTAAADASNGQNTFTTSDTGKHYYTVKAATDLVLRDRLDSFMLVESQPEKVPVNVRTTTPPPIEDNLSEGIVDYAHLMDEWVADDIVGEDRTAVATWTGRKRGIEAKARDATNEAILWNSIGGKKAVQFLSDLMDTASLTLPAEISVYAMVSLVSDITSGSRSFVTQDRAGTSSGRSFHLKSASTSPAMAAAFSGTAGYTDSSGTGRATSNEWHVFTGVRTATSIEAYYNGVSDGPTVVPNSNVIDQTVTFGGRGIGSEYMVGDYMHSVRIYFAAHTKEQIDQVIAEMKAN